jgi:ubiquinone/menaquinone biosynthesis C-methylase UbiE
MIRYTSQRAALLRNCQFQLGTAEALSLPSEQFDVVVSSLFMHHLPADLRLTALGEMWRVLRPGGTLLIAEAHVPRAPGLQLLARLHGYDRMAHAVADLERIIADAQFEQLRSGEVPPWLRYVRATKPTVS